jgi:hypothetical protein
MQGPLFAPHSIRLALAAAVAIVSCYCAGVAGVPCEDNVAGGDGVADPIIWWNSRQTFSAAEDGDDGSDFTTRIAGITSYGVAHTSYSMRSSQDTWRNTTRGMRYSQGMLDSPTAWVARIPSFSNW